jgi:acyl-CoA dehydrogenase
VAVTNETITTVAVDDPHGDLRSAVRGICSAFDDAYWREMDESHQFPWDFYNQLAAHGRIGIAIPKEYGGGGGGVTEASVLLEEIAASGAAMNGCSAIHLSIFGMNPVVKYGSDSMRQSYLPRVASGELHVSFGVTEPDAGTDTTSISTRGARVQGGYIVRGRKVWTTKADISD